MAYDIQKREQAVRGSIYDVAERTGEDLATVIADAEVVVLIDSSSSMSFGQKYERAKEALAMVQGKFEGKVIVISFGNGVEVCLRGIPATPAGMTPLYSALIKAQEFDGTGMRFIVISDGEPTDGTPDMILDLAHSFEDKIDTIFIGDDSDSAGIDFMRRLATGHSGDRVDPKLLEEKIMGYLTAGKNE